MPGDGAQLLDAVMDSVGNRRSTHYVLIGKDCTVHNGSTQEDDLMMNIGKPLVLAIGTLVGFASIALAAHRGFERVPDVDGREYVVNRWTGRISVIDTDTDGRKPL
jgi:hypothetical protein